MLKIWPAYELSVICSPVLNFAYIPDIIDQMISVLEEQNALGLAAPQIGHTINLFIMKCKNGIVEIINPVIITEDGEQFEEEGCLSFKNLHTKIKRPMQIHFHYVNRENEYKEAIVYGKEAQCFAHEMDHICGVTILNYANRQEKKRILKELSKK